MWYSKKTKKEDGLAIGTVVPIFKNSSNSWGTLDGNMNSRYPGFIYCDGRTLSKLDYPDLFDVIGYQYGGSGNNFKVPDYRNRYFMGAGPVDGNQASSPSLPTKFGPDTSSTSTGDINTAGSSGGDWYIDTVDASGTPPSEQVYQGSSPPDGLFFKLGTIRTTGYSGVTTTVPFNFAGSVQATIGPLREVPVSPPSHEHQIATAVLDTTTNGYVAWGTRAFYALNAGRYSNTNFPNLPGAPTINPGVNWSGTFTNYWASPKSNTPQINNSSGTYLAAIDCSERTANAVSWDPSELLTHNHYIQQTAYGSSTNVYGYGNVNGGGTSAGSMATNNTTTMNFSSSFVALSANEATFTLGNSKQLIPSVSLTPERTIPLIKSFFKVRYIIKAF